MSKKQIKISCIILAALIFISGSILLFYLSRNKDKQDVQAVAYITYYDQFNSNFQNSLKETAAIQEYDFLLLDSNRSTASAEANLTSAINSKATYVFIDYPNEHTTLKLARLAKESGTEPIILNFQSDDYTSLAYNYDNLQNDMVTRVQKDGYQPDLIVGLVSHEATNQVKSLVVDTSNELGEMLDVPKDYVVSTPLVNQEIAASDYVKTLLATTNDREEMLFVCDDYHLAMGVQQALVELEMENKSQIICYGYHSQMEKEISLQFQSLKPDFSIIKSMLKKPKTSEFSYEILSFN